MRKLLTIAFLVALANAPLAYAQEGLGHKSNPFEFPVTISKCQPSAVDSKHDPNPAVRVDIAVDNKGFTVAHHMANGVTYIRSEHMPFVHSRSTKTILMSRSGLGFVETIQMW
jgi:hypothetical protein